VSGEGTWDIIAAIGDGFSSAIHEVAPRYPHQKYVVTDEDAFQLDNVRQYVFVEQEGSYLVGAAAALKAVEDHVAHPSFGFIGGIPTSAIARFETGYAHGVHAVLPDAPVSIAYVNAWSDPDAAYAVANRWYDDGVFAVFTAAGGSGKGAIIAAREHRRDDKNVWAIGVDIDQYDEGLYLPNTSAVYTSMIKRVDVIIYDVLAAVYNGAFTTHTSVKFDVASRGVGYTTTNPAMSASVIGELNKIEARIISGAIDVAAPD
jgi:basic membrane protein A